MSSNVCVTKQRQDTPLSCSAAMMHAVDPMPAVRSGQLSAVALIVQFPKEATC